MRIATGRLATMAVAGTAVFACATAIVTYVAHEQSVQRAHAITNVVVQEDDPMWDCSVQGNRVCGPDGDDWGHAAGCYSDAGELVAVWPCSVRIDPITGDADIYVP